MRKVVLAADWISGLRVRDAKQMERTAVPEDGVIVDVPARAKYGKRPKMRRDTTNALLATLPVRLVQARRVVDQGECARTDQGGLRARQRAKHCCKAIG
jgi:hypothetical protein